MTLERTTARVFATAERRLLATSWRGWYHVHSAACATEAAARKVFSVLGHLLNAQLSRGFMRVRIVVAERRAAALRFSDFWMALAPYITLVVERRCA